MTNQVWTLSVYTTSQCELHQSLGATECGEVLGMI